MTLVPLSEAHRVPGCGGKAAGLGRLLERGMPCPLGVVIPDAAFRAALAELGLTSSRAELRVDPGVAAQVQRGLTEAPLAPGLLAALEAALAELGPGPYVARSSGLGEDGATASFAGQLTTALDLATLDDVATGVRAVWASWADARVLGYEAARGVELQGLGVIVQPQLAPIAAGVLFTSAPDVSEQLLIEYVAGRGDALVEGRVEPGHLRLDAANEILSAAPAGDYVLPAGAGLLLVSLGRSLAKAEGQPLDLEWALGPDGAVVLLQARPITSALAHQGLIPLRSAPRGTAHTEPPANHIRYSRVNLEENFPGPISPLLYSIAADGYRHLFANVGRAFGLSRARLEALEPLLAEVVGQHAGRLYYNLTAIRQVIEVLPGGAHLADAVDRFVGAETEDAQTEPLTWRERLEAVWVIGNVLGKALRLERTTRAFEDQAEVFASRTAPALLASRSAAGLRADLRRFVEIRTRGWRDASLVDAAAVIATGALRKLLGVVAPGDAEALKSELLQGVGDLVSSAPACELWSISRRIRSDAKARALFQHDVAAVLGGLPAHPALHAAVTDYLQAWGFRCTGELMLTVPSLAERPETLVPILAAYAELPDDSPRSPVANAARQRAAFAARRASFLAPLRRRRRWRWLPRPTLADLASKVVSRARRALADRERVRLKQALLYGRCRVLALAIGARLVSVGVLAERDDVFFFTHAELDRLLQPGSEGELRDRARDLVRERRATLAQQARLEPPRDLFLPPGGIWAPGPTVAPDDAAALVGVAASPGRVEGTARVLRSLVDAGDLSAGDVLVTTHTDPGWGPVFLLLGGLVLERGGLLSHGSILAREFGVPTVAGVPRATERIASGLRVVVDGDAGRVFLPGETL